jgi:hypothetical protein
MEMYSTLMWLAQQGEQDGRQRGLIEGECRQLRKLLLRHGKRRLGEPTPEQRAVLDVLADRCGLDPLEQARDRLLGAADWAAVLAGLEPPGARPPEPDYVEPYEFNPEPTPPSIDQYARVSLLGGGAMVIHIRFQRIYQPDLGAILYRESERLRGHYGLEVKTVVTLLWTGADGPAVTGEYAIPAGGTFSYNVARMWEKDPEEMFNSTLLAALAPLARFEPERLPEIVRRMEEAIEAFAKTDEDRHNVWIIAYTNLGLRFPAERVNELLAHRLPFIMATSPCRSTRSTAYHRGLADALREGDLRATRRWTLALGRERLGEPSAEVSAALDSITGLDRLEQVAARVLKAASWSEALAPR